LIPLNFLCKYSRNKNGLSRNQQSLLPFSIQGIFLLYLIITETIRVFMVGAIDEVIFYLNDMHGICYTIIEASEVFAITRGHKDFELCGLFLFRPFIEKGPEGPKAFNVVKL
jgi:hypothetical protein